MMRRFAITALLVVALPALAAPQSPRFADYPATDIVRTPVKKLPLRKQDEDDDYRLRRHDSITSDARANFAGRYFLTVWGCGTACVNAAIVEAASGQIIDIPFSVSGWNRVHATFRGVEFRHNSRLIVFNGERNEDGDMGRHYYVLENGALRHLRSEKTDGNFMRAAQ